MNPFHFGSLIACAEDAVDPSALFSSAGIAKRASAEDFASVGRLLAKRAYEIMKVCGRGNTAPAFHLYFISKQANWNTHADEVVEDLVRIVRALHPLEKVAFADVVGAANSALKGGWYGSLGLGAGLGSLAWLMGRHANQDAADIEAMKQQVQYYHEMGRELEDSMRRKYRYERNQSQHPGEPGSDPYNLSRGASPA